MFPKVKSFDRDLCFVLMAFKKEMTGVYEVIKTVAQANGMICQRSDEIYSTNIIIDEIWTRICEAQIVIADATGQNASVLYEIGLAHAVGKNTIILSQTLNDIPFDLRH